MNQVCIRCIRAI